MCYSLRASWNLSIFNFANKDWVLAFEQLTSVFSNTQHERITLLGHFSPDIAKIKIFLNISVSSDINFSEYKTSNPVWLLEIRP